MNNDIWAENKCIPSGKELNPAYSRDEIMQPYEDYLSKCRVLEVKPQYEAIYNISNNSLCITKFNEAIEDIQLVISKKFKSISFSEVIESELNRLDYQEEPLINIKGSPTLIVKPSSFIKLLNNNIISIENKTSLLRVYLQLINHLKNLYNDSDNFIRITQLYKTLLSHYKKQIKDFDPVETAYQAIYYLIECIHSDYVYNETDLINQLNYIEEKTKKLLKELEENEKE